MTTNSPQTLYTCPGEEHPISQAVHLSRLAAFYPKCRDCRHRYDTGQLPQQTIDRLQSTERRIRRRSLFTTEGVRGIYLNELTRSKVGHVAAGLASLLWDETPLLGRLTAGSADQRKSKRSGPLVIVGYDERPSSPDIAAGVGSALRRMGCHVVDIGLTTKPCFCFTVDHFLAAAGAYITGAGYEPAWTGLDVVGRGARPYSHCAGLDRLETRLREGFSRPTRYAGSRRAFAATVPYEAGVWKHFHALRPLQVCCGCPTPMVFRLLTQIFERLPCELHWIPVPRRVRNVVDDADADACRIAEAVRRTGSHLGMLIDDDSARCGFFDERGRMVPGRDVTRAISEIVLAEHPNGKVVIESTAIAALQSSIKFFGGQCVDGGTTAAELWTSMHDGEAVFGGGDSGRFWFREAYPACDAVLAMAKVLQALSRSDATFSATVRSDHSSR